MLLFQVETWLLFFLPGFIAAFSIGWIRSAGRPRNILRLSGISVAVGACGAALIFAALTGLFFYSTRIQVVDHSATPLTIEEASRDGCPITLPESAQNVRFVLASGGLQAFEALVRFEAPVEVCRQYLVAAHPGARLIDLDSAPAKIRPDMIGNAPWFDIEHIRHGWMDTSLDREEVWIDSNRGIYYCRITD